MRNDGAGCVLALVTLVAIGAAAVPAQAQDRWPGRLEIGAGAGMSGPSTLGSTAAALTPNQAVPADPFVLFRTRTTLDASSSVDVTLGVDITARFGVEGRLTYRRPTLSVSITDDAEQASGPGTIGEPVSEYGVDVSVRFDLGRWRFAGGRGAPFLHGGAGYLRQLHEGRVLLETGTTGHVGGGVRFLLAEPGGWLKGVGLRAQAALSLRAGGIEVDDRVRKILVAGGGMFVRF
jgi:opacity protein-like surface antigen